MKQLEFSNLVSRLKDKLFRISLDIVHDSELASDVVQEVFIKVWEKKEEMANIENLDAYCVRMTRNLSIDKTRLKHYKNQDLTVAYKLEHSNPSPSRSAEINDALSKIRELIKELPESQRQVLMLRDFDGYSYLEIADMLEIPLNQVKVYLYRARQYIRNKMEKYI
jgi:RNA polymerase sigma factor (sigma-70 family)